MKKVLLLGTLFLATLLATSCVSDDVIGGGETPDIANGFFLQLSVQEPGTTGTGTRVATIPALPGESSVYSLHLLFFEASASGMFVDYIDLSPQNKYDINNDILVEAEPLNMTAPIRIDFTNEAYLSADEDYRILVIANIHTFVGNMEALLESFRSLTFSQAQARMLSLDEYGSTMYITAEEMIMTSTIVRRGGQPMIHTNLLRLFVRFDVVLGSTGQGLPNHTLEWVEVWNVPTSTALWNSDFNTFGTHTRHFTSSGQLDPAVFEHRGVVYAFENRVANSELNDGFTTCLIVALSDSDGRITFHRVNVNVADEAQILRRNHVYTIFINRVTGLGANTPEDAWSAAVTTLEVNVRPWQDGGEGGLMFDGEDVLAIGQNRIDFPGEGCGKEGYPITIFTFSPNSDNVLRLIGGTDDGKMLIGTKTEKDTGNGLPVGMWAELCSDRRTLTVFAESTLTARYGFIELSFGTMTGVLHVVQSDQHTRWLYLSVGTTEMPVFGQAGGTVSESPVVVSSSGAWQAELFLSDTRFTFGNDINAYRLTAEGNNGDTFQVATRGALPLPRGHYAFVVVSLKDDPAINRVLVLRQDGTSSIGFENPQHANLLFNPIGRAMGSGYSGGASGVPSTPYYFRVTINPSGAAWSYSVSGYAAGYFEVKHSTGEDYLVVQRRYNKNTVGCRANQTMLDKVALITVFVLDDPGTNVQINVRQQSHNISLSAPTLTVPATGGRVPITVTASCDSWQAAFDARFGVSPGTWAVHPSVSPTQTPQHQVRVMRGNTPQTANVLTVEFDPISSTLFNASASATITVCLGVPFQNNCTSITLQQGERQLRNVNIATARPTTWGNWEVTGGSAANRNSFGRLRDELASTVNFSPIGAVVSGSRQFQVYPQPASAWFQTTNTTRGRVPNNNVDVLLANITNYNSVEAAAVRSWLEASPYRVLIVTNDLNSVSGIRSLLGTWGYVGVSQGVITARRVATSHISTDNPTIRANNVALYDFLFRNGPFSTGLGSRSTDVSMVSLDAIAGTLSSWPDTFVPIMFHPGTTNRVAVGICPARRIVYVGEQQLFPRGGRNWSNTANIEFTRNLAAWIMMVTQHGDEFTDQFR